MQCVRTSIITALILIETTFAATIHVPADHATIQDAVDVAATGDEIIVAPGVYTGIGNEVVNMLGKAITLRSSDGAASTVIDGQGNRRGVTFSGGETSNTLVFGFTITNGRAPSVNDEGGGIYSGPSSSPTIRQCYVTENLAWAGPGMMIRGAATIINCDVIDNHSYNDTSTLSMGGGICCMGHATITGCRIRDNGGYWGGGICLHNSNAEIDQCIFSGNTAVQGGGVYVRNLSPNFESCTFEGNNAEWGGAMAMYLDTGSSIMNCTMDGNVASGGGGGFFAYQHGPIVLDNCTISNNVAAGGGGLSILVSATGMNIINCRITSNSSGGLQSDMGLITLSDSLVCGNDTYQLQGPWDDGGGNEILQDCPIGACCDGLNCTLVTEAECDAVLGGQWLGDGSSCEDCLSIDEGACCLADGLRGAGCVITDQWDCLNNVGGEWMGYGTDCTACIPPPQQGACCMPSGCSMIWEDECLALGGQWLGEGVNCTNCPDTGACCLCDGCLLTWIDDCADAGGDWLAGAECSNCPPPVEVGVCCLASGCIANASEIDCSDNLGDWLGSNSSCGDCPQPCFGDLNGNWVVDVDDLMILIGAYGPCP
ncbi:MAG: right-handed parallel beta-helix repeat-containing protein [Phycisphaerales bacterium]|jgi:hypothetical protein|nr:right-handed parallel beta-helix repeat-containing protein [Phycisphaerales bacterium]MDP7087728.1 right-handed parallel beta-helix repeat-containing protein [Phycisphaerales bacterium]MDP7189720.1 right-handed parallel beta-helix repeat-containing protein [Phycisphaerales bacterium]MDP7520206.1 right-handed parallel beta-helix repeat-containing protein [Phycisphaerales bacterium]HCA39683.1 hypothetical protein [Phycisphaerales bacterium]|tara:strand:+ start:4322 stop:6112 length:1791 start_codon:yes stop_codon:yes gene_type:complete